MRSFALGALAVWVGIAALPAAAVAKSCDDDAAVVAAQVAASAECDCAGARNRGQYVACVGGVARARAAAGLLPPECQSEVLTCALRSSCGTDSVSCCRVASNGQTRCSLRQDGEHCSCIGPDDACAAAGTADGGFPCGSTTTTSSPPTTATTSPSSTTTAAPTTSTATPTTSTAAPTTSTPPTTSLPPTTTTGPVTTTTPTTSSTSTTEQPTTSTSSSSTTTLMGSPSGAFLL